MKAWALFTLASGASAAFSATSKTNVAVYWGQGPNQAPLRTVCADPNVDIVNIAFVNVYPDQGAAGWPGTNFGNACSGTTYTYKGKSTQLLNSCPDIGPDIVVCQKTYGKKVLLSIGGAYPANGYIKSVSSAQSFAQFLWGAFGPSTSAWQKAGGPRPFGDAVVDGFDFDIETELSKAPTYNGQTLNDYRSRGYTTMIKTFKNSLFTQDTSKSYYISGAPQCIVPDAHLGSVIANAWFDFLFVQFYNTPQCSAASAVNGQGFPAYTNWSKVSSLNKNVKIYLGVPASTQAANSGNYLTPASLQKLVGRIYGDARFGGIMLWEATYAAANVICHKDYKAWSKQILRAASRGQTIPASSTCPKQRVSTDGKCGVHNGPTCVGSMFGNCCSTLGYCGSSAAYCTPATCDGQGGKCGTQYIKRQEVEDAVTVSHSTTTTTSTQTIWTTVTANLAYVNLATPASSVVTSASAPYDLGNSTRAGFLSGSGTGTAPAAVVTQTVVPLAAPVAKFGAGGIVVPAVAAAPVQHAAVMYSNGTDSAATLLAANSTTAPLEFTGAGARQSVLDAGGMAVIAILVGLLFVA